MRRPRSQPRKAAEANARRRRRNAEPPAVPTYEPEPSAIPTPEPAVSQEDPAEEAVRRMVEAAYT